MDGITDTLHIQFLGGCYVSRNGIAIAEIDTARLQSFLCYLLVYAQKPQPRQQIASILWSDSTESQARTNLRKYIHRLRHILPDADRLLLMDGNTIQWRADATAVIDIHEFERYLVEALRHKQTGHKHQLATALRQAIALYQGELLPVCYDDWIAVPRDRLANQYLLAMNELITLLENTHAYTEAIYYAHRLLEPNPLDEASYQRLINLYTLAGHPSRAIEIYYQCVDVLKEELDLDPSTETRALFERVKTVQYTDVDLGNGGDALDLYSGSSAEYLQFNPGASSHDISRREQLTIVFTDIADFSKLSDANDAHLLFDRLNKYMNLLNQLIQEDNGQVVKRLGDGVLAVFAQPVDALRAAYAIQKGLRVFNQIDSHDEMLPFHTRIGVATGEVSIVYLNIKGKRECEVMGNRVNTAVRLQSLSPINGIALDQLTCIDCESMVYGKVSQTVLMANGVEEQIYIVKPEYID